MHIKPRSNYVIIDPTTKRQVPTEGMVVPDTAYWYRRVRDGDVEIIEPHFEENPQ